MAPVTSTVERGMSPLRISLRRRKGCELENCSLEPQVQAERHGADDGANGPVQAMDRIRLPRAAKYTLSGSGAITVQRAMQEVWQTALEPTRSGSLRFASMFARTRAPQPHVGLRRSAARLAGPSRSQRSSRRPRSGECSRRTRVTNFRTTAVFVGQGGCASRMSLTEEPVFRPLSGQAQG